MATPQENLAEALEVLKQLQEGNNVAIRSRDLSRAHRERLLKFGVLQEVMRGWYIPSSAHQLTGETTAWYASFWDFCAAYLNDRFDKDWCIGPEQSLALHSGNRVVPAQLVVRSPKGNNKPTNLLYSTSIFDVRAAMPSYSNIVEIDGLRLYSLGAALVYASPSVFTQNPTDMRTALSLVSDASGILTCLLEGGHTTIAGRLVGAFRNIGKNQIAEAIISTMGAAGYDVRETDPFDTSLNLTLPRRETSPYAARIRLMWQQMRGAVIENFPVASGALGDIDTYLKKIDDIYTRDAYHSLSIEGYRVSPELIDRVRHGGWNPDKNNKDREHRDALAAFGYFQAFHAVKKSIALVLANQNPGIIADTDHGNWYRELFAPSVAAGIIKSADLAGYRNDRVFIRNSRHVPLSPSAVRDAMPVFFEMLEKENNPAVRVVLGHFIFVYIHPYMDGNGRLGRFFMNLMLAAGGYPWTVIPVERREDYMSALEEASVRQNIVPFARFIGDLVMMDG